MVERPALSRARSASALGVSALRKEVINTTGRRADWLHMHEALEAMRLSAEHVELSPFSPGVCERASSSSTFNCTSRCSTLAGREGGATMADSSSSA